MRFTYKKPKRIPCKADIMAQQAFPEKFRKLQKNKVTEDKIFFMDWEHLKHNLQQTYEWIRKGREMVINANTCCKGLI